MCQSDEGVVGGEVDGEEGLDCDSLLVADDGVEVRLCSIVGAVVEVRLFRVGVGSWGILMEGG